jgi:hypothetical protein
MTPTPAQEAFEKFRQLLAFPLVKVRVNGNLMTYRLTREQEAENFAKLARTIAETTDLPLRVLPNDNRHGSFNGDYFVTIQYAE